jgi:hypothetical protein
MLLALAIRGRVGRRGEERGGRGVRPPNIKT